ncbi:MAG TPA: hypothetical protein VLC48_01430, partial [Gemmatimonadota bacterium]|nr:hypothetical protein [Gemmatimonadota bacterium]
MIDLKFLKQLIETVEQSDIDSIEISRWATKIRISKSPAFFSGVNAGNPGPIHFTLPQSGWASGTAPPAAAPPESSPAAETAPAPAPPSNLVEVTSPMVG